MKWFISLAAFTPISFMVFALIEEFFLGTVINIMILLALYSFFGKWLKALKKTDTCTNK